MITTQITNWLQNFEQQNNLQILLAVEGGSRAYGTHNDDSDYDLKFVYAHNIDKYLNLDNPSAHSYRTFITTDDGIVDIEGMEFGKFLQLFAKSNAKCFEWVLSPIVYLTTTTHQKLIEYTSQYFDTRTMLESYYGTAINQYKENEKLCSTHGIEDKKLTIRVKFYLTLVNRLLNNQDVFPSLQYEEPTFDVEQEIDRIRNINFPPHNINTDKTDLNLLFKSVVLNQLTTLNP